MTDQQMGLGLVIDGRLISKEGYVFEPHADHWQLSRDVTLSLASARRYSSQELAMHLTSVAARYAQNYSAGHTRNICDRFRAYLRWWCEETQQPVFAVSVASLISYRATLGREHEWYLASIRGLLKTWVEMRLPCVDVDVLRWFEQGRLRGNTKGRAVQTMSPTKGPLTDLEFSALHQALTDAFAADDISLHDYVLAMLFVETGRRPAQLADLKCRDLVSGRSSEGLRQYVINVPRRKVRGESFRSQFKPYALLLDLGMAIEKLVEEVCARFRRYCGPDAQGVLGLVPLFPAWDVISETAGTGRGALQGLMETDVLHSPAQALARRLGEVISALEVASERTRVLHIFPTRLRRTLARRAAREGYGELIIAELLDHSDTQNVQVYTENVPEHLDAIDMAVARQLAPLAQAFAGVLIQDKTEAVRGDDPTSRIRTDNGDIAGICGHFGFCGALVPVACYTCKFFQSFLDGPHRLMLEGLLAERERILRVTGDKTIAAINDRTIFAVAEVMRRCEDVKKKRGQIANDPEVGIESVEGKPYAG